MPAAAKAGRGTGLSHWPQGKRDGKSRRSSWQQDAAVTSSAGTLRLLPAQESYPSCCPKFSFQLESFFSPGPEKYHQLLITESSRSDLLISHSLSGWEHDCTQEQSPDSLGYFCQVSPGASSLSLSFFTRLYITAIHRIVSGFPGAIFLLFKYFPGSETHKRPLPLTNTNISACLELRLPSAR